VLGISHYLDVIARKLEATAFHTMRRSRIG
jgi:hypothetical protein